MKKIEDSLGEVDYGSPFQVYGYKVEKFKTLEGRLLTVVEALGLKDTQEEALKSIVRQEVWKLWESPQYVYDYNRKGELDTFEEDKDMDRVVTARNK